MLKQLASFLVPAIILLVLFYEITDTPFYNERELSVAREKSVRLAEQGKTEEAIKQLAALHDLAPSNKKVWGDYLLVLLRSGKSEQALHLAKEKDLSLIPPYAFGELFETALSKSDAALAIALSKAEIDQSETPVSVAIRRANQLSSAEHDHQAQEILDHARQYLKEDQYLLDIQSIVLLQQTDPQSAQEKAKELLFEKDVSSLELWQVYSSYWVNHARDGNIQAAIDELSPNITGATDYPQILGDYLVLLTWYEQFDDAENIYALIPKDYELPDHVESSVAQMLYKRGRLEEAEQHYVRLLERDPLEDEYRKGLSKVYLDANRTDEALALLQPLSAPVDADTRLIIGLIQHRMGRFHEALASLSTALHAGAKRDSKAYYAWSESFEFKLNDSPVEDLWPRYSVPLKYAPKAIVERIQDLLEPDAKPQAEVERRVPKLELIKREAAVARQRGDVPDAIALYKKALESSPNERELKLGLALAYTDAGNNAQARNIFDDLLAQYPENREILDASVYHSQKYSHESRLIGSLRKLIEISSGAQRERYIHSWLSVVHRNEMFANAEEELLELNRVKVSDHAELNLAKARLLHDMSRCSNVKETLAKVDHKNLSRQQLEEAAYLLRDCGDSKGALALYEKGMLQYPGSSVFAAGAILANTDLQQFSVAESLAQDFSTRHGNATDFSLAYAYLKFRQGDYADAFELYVQVLDKQSDNSEAYVGRVLSQAELGDAEAAYQHALKARKLFVSNDWKRLYALRAQQALRHADSSPLATRKSRAEFAISAIEEYLRFLGKSYPNDLLTRRNAKFDKVRAEVLANKPREAIATYESIDAAMHELPNWGLLNAAEAYSMGKQPEKAVELLQYVRIQQPQDLRVLLALFYAQLDLEQYEPAQNTLNDMLAVVGDEPVSGERAHWVYTLDAMFSAYQNRLSEAERKLLSLQAKAPNDPQIKMKLATVYRWRGWANKANQVLESIEPRSVNALTLLTEKTNTYIDSQQFGKAHAMHSELYPKHDYHPDVRRLNKRWRIHDTYQYLMDVQYGRSSGNTFGNKDLTFGQRLYSRPIKDDYRAYVRHQYDWAEFPEGNGRLHRAAIGGELRTQTVSAEAEVNASLRKSTDAGVTLSGRWQPNDHVSFSSGLQSYSRNVPLRGINAGVDGKSISAGAQYRWDEARHVRASVDFTDFSDGNERFAFFAEHQHGLYQSAHHQLYLSEEFYTSTNKEISGASYFNPESDWSVRIAGKYHGVLWRRYEKNLTHRVTVGVGNYKQENESNAFIWDLEYQQRWQPNETLELKYGLLHRRRTYDGDAESYNAITAGVNWRFR